MAATAAPAMAAARLEIKEAALLIGDRNRRVIKLGNSNDQSISTRREIAAHCKRRCNDSIIYAVGIYLDYWLLELIGR